MTTIPLLPLQLWTPFLEIHGRLFLKYKYVQSGRRRIFAGSGEPRCTEGKLGFSTISPTCIRSASSPPLRIPQRPITQHRGRMGEDSTPPTNENLCNTRCLTCRLLAFPMNCATRPEIAICLPKPQVDMCPKTHARADDVLPRLPIQKTEESSVPRCLQNRFGTSMHANKLW